MVERAWASMGYFLHHLDPEIRKITRRFRPLEDFEKETICHLLLNMLVYIYIYIYIYIL